MQDEAVQRVQKSLTILLYMTHRQLSDIAPKKRQQEDQLMLTTGSTRLAVSRGQQTWYHFRSIATFR